MTGLNPQRSKPIFDSFLDHVSENNKNNVSVNSERINRNIFDTRENKNCVVDKLI